MLRSKLIETPLPTRRHRAALLALAMLLAGGLITAVISVALPAQLADSQNLERVRKASKMDPENDAIRHQVGRQYLALGALSEARPHLEQAIALNPRHARYWADLARACFLRGDSACANESYSMTVQVAPMNPEYVWDRATYFAVMGRRAEALAGFARYVQLAPNDAGSAFEATLRLYQEADVVWNSVAKLAGIEAQLALLTWLAWRGRSGETAQWWEQIKNSDVPLKPLQAYSEALVQRGNFALATRVWSRFKSASAGRFTGSANLIYNPDFALPPSNSGFDWHLARQWFVQTSVEREDHRPAIRVNYSVAHNADSEPAYEFVPVEPNTTYVLTADVKADSITSPSGPRLRVADAQCPQCLNTSSEDVVGTVAWHKIELRFDTTANTRYLRVSVFRPRAREFPMEITGTVWLTGFDLIQSASAPMARGEGRPQ